MKTQGKDIIRGIVQAAKQLDHDVTFVHLEDYDMTLAQLMAVGVDLWLNTPQRLLKTSRTSVLTAPPNEFSCLSFLDAWWLERHTQRVTEWSIGYQRPGDK
ncbi:MAG: hypothetical protein H8K06_08220 [Nitrospira sp.]|nr:hypothetical protein [Nitrospira sp.]